MREEKQIVILLYQYSVVVKGIEKMLADMGYHVSSTVHFDEIRLLLRETDLFIWYLPADIMDGRERLNDFMMDFNLLKKKNKRMLILGEKKDRPDLAQVIPGIADYVWLDRPIENDVLKKAAAEVLAADAGAASEKKSILIVDDDPAYAGMVREWIRDTYKTNVVTAGMQAITFLLKNPVDLVLLDYEMPVADGPQVLAMLRQDPATKDIPVVFLTGVSTKEQVSRVVELKPDGYVLKSTTRENLLAFLNSKLSGTRAQA
ncbi:MAG: response regulator [Lachnospiraceae bacterium]|nr:response regulator [Lachnospiraceae bacterium]